jgi:dienelactone hydrolase
LIKLSAMKRFFIAILSLIFFSSLSIVDSFAAKKLLFEKAPKELSSFSSIRNAVFAPSKNSNNVGRALVISPTCDGLRSDGKTNGDYRAWIKFFVNEGYTVLMLDHYNQRNIDGPSNGCGMDYKRKLITNYDLPIDVLDAVEHLSVMPGVDKNKIFAIGFSLGTMANAYVASKNWYETFGDKRLRPRAAGGLYGACLMGPAKRVLNTDVDIPVFWLMGSKDIETPPSDCLPIIKGIEDRKETKIYWHIYEGATHCWDCASKNGHSRYMPWNGKTTTYIYNSKYAKDSMQRALDFFNSFK